eukprot:g1846.t1
MGISGLERWLRHTFPAAFVKATPRRDITHVSVDINGLLHIGSLCPDEGELKMLRSLYEAVESGEAAAAAARKTHHCLVGDDADLLIMALMSGVAADVSVMRSGQGMKGGGRGGGGGAPAAAFFSVPVLEEALRKAFEQPQPLHQQDQQDQQQQQQQQEPRGEGGPTSCEIAETEHGLAALLGIDGGRLSEDELRQIKRDLCVLSLLSGNDYLPGISGLTGGLEALWARAER